MWTAFSNSWSLISSLSCLCSLNVFISGIGVSIGSGRSGSVFTWTWIATKVCCITQHYQEAPLVCSAPVVPVVPVCQLLLEGVLANKSHKDFTLELQTLKWGHLYFSFTALVARNNFLHSPVCCLQAHQTKIWCHHLPAGYSSHSEKCGVSTEHASRGEIIWSCWVAAVMTLVVVKY